MSNAVATANNGATETKGTLDPAKPHTCGRREGACEGCEWDARARARFAITEVCERIEASAIEQSLAASNAIALLRMAEERNQKLLRENELLNAANKLIAVTERAKCIDAARERIRYYESECEGQAAFGALGVLEAIQRLPEVGGGK